MRFARLAVVALTILAAPLASFAQPPPGKAPRIGLLISETVTGQASRIEALRAGLRDRGYVEGQTIAIEVRSAEGEYERLPGLAAELARLRVDVIVAFGIKALVAAKAATTTIPIVIPVTSSDPVAMGLVDSLARPGGNITGSTTFGPEVMAKRLELLRELVPRVTRVAILVNPANASFGPTLRQMKVTAQSLKLSLQPFEVRAPAEIDGVFGAMAKGRVDAMVVQEDTMFGVNAKAIADLAARKRLPVAGNRAFAEAGAVIGYGGTDAGLYSRGAYFVDRILKGAKPGDLPIEQSTKFELVINLKTAKGLGLTIPPAVLARADEVIE
jgi:ABC-type uncharacterized transport system substrate-binding protein